MTERIDMGEPDWALLDQDPAERLEIIYEFAPELLNLAAFTPTQLTVAYAVLLGLSQNADLLIYKRDKPQASYDWWRHGGNVIEGDED
jgi:hypothetical protein